MKIYPAIDILSGQVVRLRQGSYEAVTVYNADPADQAKKWVAVGATILHVVDLNGAAEGVPVNTASIKAIVDAVDVPVQLGGGLRHVGQIDEALAMGVARVVLGTSLIKTPELVAEACQKHPGLIVAAIDARNGMVAVEGWREGTEFRVSEILPDLEMMGVQYLLYTDIGGDGMMTGINVDTYARLIAQTHMKVIASGGVSDIEDVKALGTLAPAGLEGVIIGRALYEGTLDLAEAIAVATQASAA